MLSSDWLSGSEVMLNSLKTCQLKELYKGQCTVSCSLIPNKLTQSDQDPNVKHSLVIKKTAHDGLGRSVFLRFVPHSSFI